MALRKSHRICAVREEENYKAFLQSDPAERVFPNTGRVATTRQSSGASSSRLQDRMQSHDKIKPVPASSPQ